MGYCYQSAFNKLDRVYEPTGTYYKLKGFKFNAGGYQFYTNDANGNWTSDDDRGISCVKYNRLNLPKQVTW